MTNHDPFCTLSVHGICKHSGPWWVCSYLSSNFQTIHDVLSTLLCTLAANMTNWDAIGSSAELTIVVYIVCVGPIGHVCLELFSPIFCLYPLCTLQYPLGSKAKSLVPPWEVLNVHRISVAFVGSMGKVGLNVSFPSFADFLRSSQPL